MVQQVAAIKDKGWLHHGVVNALIVIRLELIPLCQNCQSMRIIACLIGVLSHSDCIGLLVLLAAAWVIPLKFGSGQVCEYLLPCDLKIKDINELPCCFAKLHVIGCSSRLSINHWFVANPGM